MGKHAAAKRNQSVNTACSIHLSIMTLFVSNESNSIAIHKLKDRKAFISEESGIKNEPIQSNVLRVMRLKTKKCLVKAV